MSSSSSYLHAYMIHIYLLIILLLYHSCTTTRLSLYVDAIGEGTAAGAAVVQQQQPVVGYQPAAVVQGQPVGYQTQQVGTVVQQVGTAYQTAAAIQAQPVTAYQTRQAVVQP